MLRRKEAVEVARRTRVGSGPALWGADRPRPTQDGLIVLLMMCPPGWNPM